VNVRLRTRRWLRGRAEFSVSGHECPFRPLAEPAAFGGRGRAEYGTSGAKACPVGAVPVPPADLAVPSPAPLSANARLGAKTFLIARRRVSAGAGALSVADGDLLGGRIGRL
jgi:hypothetical protein